MVWLLELIAQVMMAVEPTRIPAPAIVWELVIHVNAIGWLLIVGAQGSSSRLVR